MRWRMLTCGLLSLVCLAFAADGSAEVLKADEQIPLEGDLAYPEELSGIAVVRQLTIIAPDEGAEINVFRRRGDGYELLAKSSLLPDAEDEIDMEAAASDGDQLFVIGSHSMRRKQVEEDSTYKKNRKRLTRVTPHEASYSLFRLRLDEEGRVASSEQISLADVIEDDEILGPYAAVSGKENGVDIEGLAVKEGRVYVGFRGPVLRGNFVPVLRFAFDEPEEYEILFVELAGRGIRDLAATKDGLLLLAGPVGDGDATYQLYHWNGADCVPGDDGPGGEVALLGELAPKNGAKPEGVAIVEETDAAWGLLIVSDGDPAAASYTVPKP